MWLCRTLQLRHHSVLGLWPWLRPRLLGMPDEEESRQGESGTGCAQARSEEEVTCRPNYCTFDKDMSIGQRFSTRRGKSLPNLFSTAGGRNPFSRKGGDASLRHRCSTLPTCCLNATLDYSGFPGRDRTPLFDYSAT